MGDVIKAVRVILEEFEGLTSPERGRVLGTLIALQGDCVPVQLGTPAPGSTPEPAPKPYPKAGGVRPSERSGVLPQDGGPSGLDLLPRLLEALRKSPDGMTNAELQTTLGVSREAVVRGLLAARKRGLTQGSSAGLGCRHSLTRKGQQA